MPYFYSEAFGKFQKRKAIYKSLSEGWKYCCSATPLPGMTIHMPLTLNEYCKPVLGARILDERNKDQVVQRYVSRKEESARKDGKLLDEKNEEGPDPRRVRVLTVHQAWVWKIDNLVLAAFFDESQGRFGARWEEATEHDVGDQLIRVGKLLSYLINFLDRPVSAGLSEPLFNTFEKSIIFLSDDVNDYIRSSKIDDFSLDKEVQYYREIGDIREELSMIKSVLLQQEEVWKEFISTAWPNYWVDGRFTPPFNDGFGAWRDIARPQVQFPKFKRRIAQLDEDAQRVENSISITLDLKAKHAGLRQTQASTKEAHSAAVMSAAVFGFTIVTIIFTPLSFMLALFALPLQRLQDNQIASRWSSDSGMYTTNYVGKWMAAGELVSVFVTVVFMWAAIEWGLDDPIAKRAWQRIESTRLGRWLKNTKTWQWLKGLWLWIRTTTRSKSTAKKQGPPTVPGAGTAQPQPEDAHRRPRRRAAHRDDVEKGELEP
ncbi:uncharacterized protein BDZ99DRAFT_467031 [Mytilinidion resinicola]|uniref:Ankyrin repeat protein n=1 Tax=Mytilinidion resinicola TaxID=574789 RepID=A0A6A6Y9V3_9PEZI|nr:uncharacterized protein BDZ99DRAFT_467031 [Mytilinidion resinicola]KAF2804774.1 hypothetical protein BDZ99DRAFT_467031 [Mytilinidion resinicola]